MRIKTLAEIGEQHDRVMQYLIKQGRIKTACKVENLCTCILARVFDRLGVTECDDDTLEWVLCEPLIVGVSY